MNYGSMPDPRQACAICETETIGPAPSLPVPGAPLRMRIRVCRDCAADWAQSETFRRAYRETLAEAAAAILRRRVADIMGLSVEHFDGMNGLDEAAAAVGLPRARVEAAMVEALRGAA